MNRRTFLRTTAGAGGALALGPSFWSQAWASPVTPTDGPYGPLQAADANGLMLPAGFTSRVIGIYGVPVEGTTYPWHMFPDGSGCVADPDTDGGWILVSNSESPPGVDQIPADFPVIAELGGVSAVRFAPDGTVVDAYRILEGTRTNCAGGVTPWGTWLSCEEFDTGPGGPGSAGRVWECDPTGRTPAQVLPALGSFKHEAAAVDPERRRVYLTEDETDGLLYRATPSSWPDLSDGVLEAAELHDDGTVSWHGVPDATASALETRKQVEAATTFNGGEGCFYDQGSVYFTTKGDDRVWRHDVDADTIEVIYDGVAQPEAPLRGVDNIIVAERSGDILVAEDGDDMEIVLITPEREMAPLVQATGPQHGDKDLTEQYKSLIHSLGLPSPFSELEGLPIVSEITGLAFTPDGSRLYFNSQRGFAFGVTYEVTGPFRTAPRGSGSLQMPAADAAGAAAGAESDGSVGVLGAERTNEGLAASGLSAPVGAVGLGALGAALVAWRTRSLIDDSDR